MQETTKILPESHVIVRYRLHLSCGRLAQTGFLPKWQLRGVGTHGMYGGELRLGRHNLQMVGNHACIYVIWIPVPWMLFIWIASRGCNQCAENACISSHWAHRLDVSHLHVIPWNFNGFYIFLKLYFDVFLLISFKLWCFSNRNFYAFC